MSGSVHGLFEERAARHPDATALIAPHAAAHLEPRRVSYGELDRLADRVAARLRTEGARPGDLIGLAAGRSVEMVAGMLGILKAGAAYVPLDPAYPRERLDFMVADAGLRLILTSSHNAAAAGGSGRSVELDGILAGSADGPAEPAADSSSHGARPADPAYVIYTSGSTGTPKGVVVPHRAILRLVLDATYARLDESTVTLQLAPISFDAATFEIWGPLLNGGTCVLAPDTGVPDLALLRRVVAETGVTTMWLTASLFNLIIDRAPDTLGTVVEVLTGGEALSVPHVRRALELLPRAQLINGYGPTESTTFACCYRIPRPLPATLASVPIGTPITRTTVHLLDEALTPVARGDAGDLYIGGDGLALGYLKRPELTAERFIEHPLAGEGRLYRTGDRARELPDGTIEFLGRLDDQVKIRGHRVELGEVEAALRALPEVGDAVVALREDVPGEKQLVAYYTASGARAAAPEALRATLEQRLPEYMLPAHYVVLDAIPVTANGKADRLALPAPAPRLRIVDRTAVSPRTPVEEWLAGLWREVLGLEVVGVHDRFFELGGTSLTAMRLLARLRDETAADLPALLLFRAATIAELAALLERDHADVLPAGLAPQTLTASIAGSMVQNRERQRDELRARRLRRRNG